QRRPPGTLHDGARHVAHGVSDSRNESLELPGRAKMARSVSSLTQRTRCAGLVKRRCAYQSPSRVDDDPSQLSGFALSRFKSLAVHRNANTTDLFHVNGLRVTNRHAYPFLCGLALVGPLC